MYNKYKFDIDEREKIHNNILCKSTKKEYISDSLVVS